MADPNAKSYFFVPNCTEVIVKNNTNQLIILENKNFIEIICKILNIR